MREKLYYIRLILNVYFEFSKSSFINFNIKYFCLSYIIFDAKYMSEVCFKHIFLDIIFIKYYIIQTKIFKVNVEKKILKKSKVDIYYGTDGVFN